MALGVQRQPDETIKNLSIHCEVMSFKNTQIDKDFSVIRFYLKECIIYLMLIGKAVCPSFLLSSFKQYFFNQVLTVNCLLFGMGHSI